MSVNTKSKKVIISILSLAACLFLVTYFSPRSVGNNNGSDESKSNINQNKIKIGVVLPATGKLASYSEDIQNALMLAGERYSENLEFFIEDSMAEPQKGISAIQNLIQNKKVQAVITGPGSTVNIPMAPIAEKASVPFFAISSTAELIGKDDFTFILQPTITKEVARMSEFLISYQSSSKAAVIYDSASDTLTTGSKQFEENFTSLGGQVVVKEGYAKDVQYGTIAAKVITSRPDTVYLLVQDKPAASLIKSLRDLGFKGTIATFSGVEFEEFIENTKGWNEDVILASIPFSCDSSESTRKYCEKYKARFNNRAPQQYGAYAYDIVTQLVNSYKTCPSKVGEGLRKCILNNAMVADKTSDENLTDSFSVDAYGDLSKNVPIYIKIIKDSKFVRIDDN